MTSQKTKQRLPGWGLKTTSKILVILSIVLIGLGFIGGGAGGGAALTFFSFLFLLIPAIVLYASGRRVQKKAVKRMQQNDTIQGYSNNYPGAPSPPQQPSKPMKVKARGSGGGCRGHGKAIFGVIFTVLGGIILGYGFLTLAGAALVSGIIFFFLGTLLLAWSVGEEGGRMYFPKLRWWRGRRYYY